ncbi:MAG TPA: S1 RNA-binding domain-containing protein [Candidatus Eisenbacteria bacterium]
MMFNDDTPETQEQAAPAFDAEAITSPREVAAGEKVTGTVVKIGETTSFVDFGGRSEGSIETSEFKSEDGTLTVKEGDTIEATVLAVGDGITLTIGKAKGPSVDLGFIDAASASGAPLEGTVKAVNKGGVVVDIGGVRAFCPVAQIDIAYVADPSAWVGRQLAFRVTQWDRDKKNLVVSRRALLQEERDRKGTETRGKLAVGQDLDGVVKRLAAFGAFIDLGGVEGLAHVSELSRSRVANPSDVLKEGQSVRVKVIKIEDLSGAKERISLSLKALEADPWSSVAAQFQEGQVVEGNIVRLADFGAFVELAPGIDGLIHVSELGHGSVAHPRDAVATGDKVTARVQRIEPDRKRISLSLKALMPAPPPEPRTQVNIGTEVEGTVASVKNYGIFVNLPSLGARVSGLVPRAETGESRGADLARRFPVGSPIKAEIIQVDEQGRIKLSMAAHATSSERRDLEEFKRSQPQRSEQPNMNPLAELLRPLKEKMESGQG